ncbi:MAG: glycosyltransferase family 39 protein, partial [Flavobacterium sp.]|nr:glycosyltransferase family 39 protein [Flavobacterium sp.]
LLSFWYRMAGDTLTSYRLFSVLMFLLTLPFLYGLSRQLFGSKKAGLIAVSLFSISPFIHYFAQEARYYMLWVLLITVIHYFLIKAIHLKHNKWWAGYILFGVLSLYGSALSGFILFEHLLFVFFIKKELRVKFLIILGIIGLMYLPWFYFVYTFREQVYISLSWHKYNEVTYWAPLLGFVLGLVRIFSFYQNYTLFWDDVFNNITTAMIIETFFNVLILALIVISVVVMLKKEKKETAWFVLLILIPGLIFFWGLDIIRNAITTHWWRYYIFNTLPVVLLVAYLINKYIDLKKTLFITIYLCLSGIGIYSIVTISKYKYWYIGGNWIDEFVDNAELLSKAENPLMVSDFKRLNNTWTGPMHSMVILANCTSPNIDVLRVSTQVEDFKELIAHGHYSDIFVINASDSLLVNLKQHFENKLTILPGRKG